MKTNSLRGDKWIAEALVFIVLTIVFVSSFISAIPGIPHQFWGSVKDSNGNPAPDGVLITARINGENNNGDLAGTLTKNGTYGLYNGIFYVPDPDGDRAGKTIGFFIPSLNNLKVGEYVFKNGETTELNFVVSGVDWSQSSGGGNGGGSGGGSSGGGGASSSTGSSSGGLSGGSSASSLNLSNNNCVENWVCSDWLDCTGTIQKRVCVDKNDCGTELNKPETQRECVSEELQKAQGPQGITGFFFNTIKNFKNPLVSGIIVLIVIAVILTLVFYFKKHKKSQIGKGSVDSKTKTKSQKTNEKTSKKTKKE